MRLRNISVFAMALAGAFSAFAAVSLDLNGVWQFRFEEGKSIEQVANENFEANDAMSVPTCFDTMPRYFLKRGTALYRRTFTLDRAVDNAWVVVDGMGLRGDFRIDGKSLGIHPYPYARLELETGPLSAGEHVLFVALDNRFDWETLKLVRPYYDFYFYGGFYHGVKLAFDNRRLFVRTRDYKTGKVELEAVNFKARDFDAELIFDGKNKVNARFANSRAVVNVPNFKLWSPESPTMHSVCFDGVSERFGVRTVEARNRAIWLNGKKIFLKGVNRHDSHIEFGVTTSRPQMLRDLQILKGLGANFIRGAHYQQTPAFLDLCDEVGILVWEESLGWGNGQRYTERYEKINEITNAVFIAEQIHETRQMVRTSINHPSIIISAFLNECGSEREDCKVLVDKLIETIRAEDTGHLVTFACNHWKNDICNANTDIAAGNAYPGTIPAQPGLPETLNAHVTNTFISIVKHFRELYPDKPIIISESGVGATYGMHDPAASFGTEEFQDEYLGDILKVLWDNPDVVGYAIWQFADNRTYHRNSEAQGSKMHGVSIAGIVNHQRMPKKSCETVKKYFTEITPKSMEK